MSELAPRVERPSEEPRGWGARFVEREAIETAARVAMSIESPWLLPVVSASPVVYAGSIEGARPDVPLSIADAVECLLQLCDVLSRAHSAGWLGLAVDLHDVRVFRDGEGWRVSVVIPHLPTRGRFPHALWTQRSPARGDLCTAVLFLRDLVVGHVPEPLSMWGQSSEYTRGEIPELGDDRVRARLVELFDHESHAPSITSAASLAEAVLPLARNTDTWRTRIDAMPERAPASLRRDWDRLVELGEAELTERPGDPYVVLPLAAAWHQRACVAFSRRDSAAALSDIDRCLALDRWCRYLVTRGSVREAAGDLRGALDDFTEAVDSVRLHGPWNLDDDLNFPSSRWLSKDGFSPGASEDGARALYARGVTRYRLGDLDGAHQDLTDAASDAYDLSHDGGSARFAFASLIDRALVTVLRARIAAGHDDDRPPLVEALRALGRRDEALTEARVVLASRPDDERLRKRYRRRFGDAIDEV